MADVDEELEFQQLLWTLRATRRDADEAQFPTADAGAAGGSAATEVFSQQGAAVGSGDRLKHSRRTVAAEDSQLIVLD